ncbi:cystatin-A5-like [Oreochromis aureus]|uniref:Cystatin-B n=1 Tax=Oreochromis aureus TaxID=47969 RepID=A0AAZ1X904_OREAU|nr:cystatin-A5-like [Oreochromis aureus]
MTDAKPGGWSDTKDATPEIQKICDEVKGQVEAKTKKKYEEFLAVKYRNQIVKGTKYAIKVHVGGPSYLHVDLFKSLPNNGEDIELIKVEENHTKDDPINAF